MRLFKFSEAVQFLGLTPSTVNTLVRREEIACIVIAGQRRFYEDALVAYADRVGLRLTPSQPVASPVVTPSVELDANGLPIIA